MDLVAKINRITKEIEDLDRLIVVLGTVDGKLKDAIYKDRAAKRKELIDTLNKLYATL